MFSKKWYEWIMTLVYIAMVLLCVFLNFTEGHRESLATIIVNVAMFVIVGIIFISADWGSFAKMNTIIKDLTRASEKIRGDALNTHSYLWEPYKTNKVEIFKTKYLQDLFRDFVFELNREQEGTVTYYKPSIDDYINEELVDSVMHRNELNQVPGMLTGLGILGTFIGLSLGLQNFNTGTTAEMTASIEPLMNGIKVAFHTSIYGMVFSLTFNTIYKKKLYEAEAAVHSFTKAFKQYVLPDTTNDGMNQLIALSSQQLYAISNMSISMTEELANMINPHLDKLHESVVDFENMATRNQTESMRKIVEFFVTEMNKSLGNTFLRLNQSVEEMYQAQKKSMTLMQEIITTTGNSTGNMEQINIETGKLVATLNNYSESIQAVLNELQKTLAALDSQDTKSAELVDKEILMLQEQRDMIADFKESMQDFIKHTERSQEQVSDSISEINDGIFFLKKAFDKKNIRR